MVCIYCGTETGVKNSRLQKKSNIVWRRRACRACGAVFTTQEKIDLSNALMFSDKAGSIHNFSRDNLFLSIRESCKHRVASIDDCTHITQTIIDNLTHGDISNGIIDRNSVIQACHKVLLNFDGVAAAVYKGIYGA